MPAQAGIRFGWLWIHAWTPACAGVTTLGELSQA
jgi:hypothetical protein